MRLRNADLRWMWTEAGTLTMLVAVAEGAVQMVTHSFERALYMNAILGCSKGLSLVLIMEVILAQLACSVALVVPHIYYTTGVFAPSIVLAATLWFEALLFGELADVAVAARSAAMTLTAVMLAILRYDRQERNLVQQLPTSSWVLNVEQRVRAACSVARTGYYMPFMALALVLWGTLCNPFWRTHGIAKEWYRSRFQAALAAASAMFLIGGQDTKSAVCATAWAERYFSREKAL